MADWRLERDGWSNIRATCRDCEWRSDSRNALANAKGHVESTHHHVHVVGISHTILWWNE